MKPSERRRAGFHKGLIAVAVLVPTCLVGAVLLMALGWLWTGLALGGAPFFVHAALGLWYFDGKDHDTPKPTDQKAEA